MLLTKEHRLTLQKVMRRASQADLSEAIETARQREVGYRLSPGRTFQGFGEVKAIVEWEPDIPYDAIDWDRSREEYPLKRLALEREQTSCIDWTLVHDASSTMDFGTHDLTKREFGAALGGMFSQAALKKRDRVRTIVLDDNKVGLVLDGAPAEEIALLTLAYDSRKPFMRVRLDASKNGLSMSMAQLSETQGIVPVMSDFLQLIDKDRRGRLTKAAESARLGLKRAARYHKVLACVIEDPREKIFPDAQAEVTIEDTRGARETMTYAEANLRVSEDRKTRLAELQAFFTQSRIQHAVFSPDDKSHDLRTKVLKLMVRVAAMGVW